MNKTLISGLALTLTLTGCSSVFSPDLAGEYSHPAAFAEYTETAEQGDLAAMYELGMHYRYGYSTSVQPDMAFEQFKKAAARGFAPAQMEYSKMFADGVGTEANPKAAAFWLKKAAKANEVAQYELAMHYRSGELVAADEAMAFEYIKKAAVRGYAPAQVEYADMFANGTGVKQNAKAAQFWLKKAAAQGSEEAVAMLDKISL